MTTDERIATERITQACLLIRSAYRLHTLDPAETLLRVRSAIEEGVARQAADVAEHLNRLAGS